MDLRKKNYLQPIINIKLDLLKFTSVKMLPKKKKTSSMVMKAKKKISNGPKALKFYKSIKEKVYGSKFPRIFR